MTRFANALRNLGIEKDDCVSLYLHNSAEFAVAVYAISRAGATINPINYRLAEEELSYILKDIDSDALLYEEDTRQTVPAVMDDGDTASIDQHVYIDDDWNNTPDGSEGFHTLVENGDDSPLDVDIHSEEPYIIVYT